MGRFIHSIFINAFSGMIAHALVFFQNEKKGTLFFSLRLLRIERSLKDVATALMENDLQPHSMSTKTAKALDDLKTS